MPLNVDKINTGSLFIDGSEVTPGGGGFDPSNVEIVEVNVIDALEGTSIPDSPSASYIKTISLGFNTIPTKVLAIISTGSLPSLNYYNGEPYTYGVSSNGIDTGNIPQSNPTLFDSKARLLVTTDYTQTKRTQQYSMAGGEINETGNGFPDYNILSYTQFPTLFGVYAFANVGVGYTSSSSVTTQTHSVIKSAYLSGNNLVIMFKKMTPTSNETFSNGVFNNPGIAFRVYKLA